MTLLETHTHLELRSLTEGLTAVLEQEILQHPACGQHPCWAALAEEARAKLTQLSDAIDAAQGLPSRPTPEQEVAYLWQDEGAGD